MNSTDTAQDNIDAATPPPLWNERYAIGQALGIVRGLATEPADTAAPSAEAPTTTTAPEPTITLAAVAEPEPFDLATLPTSSPQQVPPSPTWLRTEELHRL